MAERTNENFQGRFRGECLNLEHFRSRAKIPSRPLRAVGARSPRDNLGATCACINGSPVVYGVGGDFEWDVKHGTAYRFLKRLPSSPTLPPYTSTTGQAPNVWSSSECRFAIAFFSSCTLSSLRRDRIISARPATRAERDVYASGLIS
jgi:hypothetical protein